ncbi:VTT domain-containing protein [Silvanigrella aquatica]|uniref:VTT domain-containing protein n=1 Tax=Silvanigrella aquatica TaxID=1915309 RepID=A0A1L4CXB7_9BACT|nr:VTT domain-containing protein [Silvanigrella aquatica]APJ02590.1 hypothetical protein AXG55_01030 [Silvanigrella aquatica]
MLYFYSIFIGTFILEDIAIASSIILINQGKISFAEAFLACFLGISIGDLGLYFIGFIILKFNLEKKVKFLKKLKNMNTKNLMTFSIIVSRIIPGTRMPTYIGAGILKYPILNFIIITLITVNSWTIIALISGKELFKTFTNHWFIGFIIIVLFFHTIKFIIQKISSYWELKSLLYSWRKFLYFEFWPSFILYIPSFFIYIFLSLKYKSILIPFYANKNIINGGLIGESKWDFLKYLDSDDSSTLKCIKLNKSKSLSHVCKLLSDNKFYYPLVLKPDFGQRGFGVRIIQNEEELNNYILTSDFDIVVQKFSAYENEADIFYIRYPAEKMGMIFSITNKVFPFIIGDGNKNIGNLILSDKRARIISSIYFSRLKDKLNEIPCQGEKIYLSKCGNHCQGTIFQNGTHLITEKLTLEIDRISKQIPEFYFGRIDLKYKNQESLKEGRDLEIVEINGAGAEAAHIWVNNKTLVNAYKTLFTQWKILFEIGHAVHSTSIKKSNVNLKLFIVSFVKYFFRDKNFTISS